MKEQLPSPEFNSGQYERPNQNWICGKAAEGKPCRIGPDAKGRCRATYECRPALEIKEGENKGRYRCTRTADYGGTCGTGPRPDGTCSRPILKCVPARGLHARRKLFTMSIVAVTAGILLVGLGGPFRARFITPGKLSAQHATETFARLAGTRDAGCEACHRYAHAGPGGLLTAALEADPGPFQFRALATARPPAMTSLDQNCQHCHVGHSFHQPNVVRDHSCSACHREHQGSGTMPHPTDANCRSCHSDEEAMQASLQLGRKLPAAAFDFRPEQGRVLFKAPRPERGYTKIIHRFATDHPEFQVLAQKLKDPDTLHFNHALHLTSPNIAPLKGRKLDCADCHKPDAAGVYHLKISYNDHCQNCHSLQFDVHNPDLPVPHGNAGHVRDFLRSLPEQYADYGAKKGIQGRRELEAFVQEQMKQIREQAGSGGELERRVFFSDARTGPVARIGLTGGLGAARFPGCAYCHEVAPSGGEVPQVSSPVLTDRWLIRGRFDHGKHFKVACVFCHAAERSRESSDVLLPSKQICVRCHSPQGGVADDCSTCHSYHAPRKETVAAR